MENLGLYRLTRCDNDNSWSKYEITKGITSKTNPYFSDTAICFTKFITASWAIFITILIIQIKNWLSLIKRRDNFFFITNLFMQHISIIKID